MKELHLICNAHLDPVWQWDWNEGISAALATFHAAAQLAEEYDYIFCHNEAFLYECIEKYDPALFARIQDLVRQGKWHIMGGWYIQPDCNIPSGEGFIRQIESGLHYFSEKFGVRPTVAVNFDTFGHTRGLVQILKKCGYEGYIFCRPMKELLDLPEMLFDWVGFDGSRVKAARFEDLTIYCSGLGTAVADITRKMQPWETEEVAFALWGVGNHGGGASRKDLADIQNFIGEKSMQGISVFHSTPERFFAKATPKAEYREALQPCLVKCYSSDSRLKHKYAELENKLLTTEKLCACAAAEGCLEYDLQAFSEAQKQLSAIQFHDILSGTSILEGEQSSLRKADFALEVLDAQFSKAFFSLCAGYEKAIDGEYPIFVFNPRPYPTEEVFECEILILNGMVSETEGYELTIRKDGKACPFQLVKEASTINMDRRKRLAVKAELNPLSLTRFDISVTKGKKQHLDRTPQTQFAFAKDIQAEFCPETGCLSGFAVRGKEYLNGCAFMPVVFDDNPDPWGWGVTLLGTNYQRPKATVSLRVVERGDILTTLESIYDTGKSEIRVAYKIYRDFEYIDVTVNICWNDSGKGLKLELPLKEMGRFIGQTAFGIQEYEPEAEQCSQRFCGVEMGDHILAVFKDGTYGCSVENGNLYITLLNGSVYCAHPVGDLPIIDENRFHPYLALGRHTFSFRLEVCKEEELERKATEFTQVPYALNVYPHGTGIKKESSPISLSNPNIVLSAFRKTSPDCYTIRLVNNCRKEASCDCEAFGQTLPLSFGRYEAKTLIYKDGTLQESDSMLP